MRYKNILIIVAIVALFGTGPVIAADTNPNGPYLGEQPPSETPVLFAPGKLPVDGSQHCVPSFSPDGNAVFWMNIDRSGGRPKGKIWFMKATESGWSEPAIAAFSGEYSDGNPYVSADGKRIYFTSVRPGNIGKQNNIWYVEKTDTGFSKPINLGSPPNTEIGVRQMSFTNNETIYFVGFKEGTQWRSGIYRSRYDGEKYLSPEPLPMPISTEHADVYPYIAPDESYLLFGSTRPGAYSSETDLYISYHNPDDSWSEPIQLDETINNGKTVSFSTVTHDGKYLFFNRFDDSGTDKFFWVQASVLNKYNKQKN